MKKRISDIIADILVQQGVTHMFSLVGGGAMFLNDAFGHKEGLHVFYNQHEQACAMAAEGYARATGRLPAVCVTTGPGGTNAITGVLGAFQDNYPMLVITGQVRYETTADSTGLPLRFMGEQEHNIVDTVRNLTKYAVMVKRAEDVRYELEKAVWLAMNGRRGPCWVDVPLNIQSALAEPESMRPFVPQEQPLLWDKRAILAALQSAKRPVILAGSAVRSSGVTELFRSVTARLGVPVLSATYNADLMHWDHPCYFGGFGVNGGRAGNFIVQNADLVVGLGCRMTYRQIGFNFEAFSPDSRKIVVDVDAAELQKPTLRIDLPVHADLRDVLEALGESGFAFEDSCRWLDYCRMLKERYPGYLEKFDSSSAVNPYYFARALQSMLPDGSVTVLGNSTIAGHILQLGIAKERQRIINNMNCGSMGYDLPAAVGAAVGVGGEVTLVTGDGSIMLNIQELLSISASRLPVKIFVCSNGGYRGIVRSQSNMFGGRYVGCTPETGVAMPDFEKLAAAFGLPYLKISNHSRLADGLRRVYECDGPVLCEVMQDIDQVIEPRSSSRRLEDGSIVSPPIDDLFPFLGEEEYRRAQYSDFIAGQGK